MSNEYVVFGYNAPEGAQLVIYEMGNLTGDAYMERYQEGFDEFGGYGLGKFKTLEEVRAEYPNARLVPLNQ